ncbi:MAG: hypothetical protein L3J69_09745 [Desulfobacula sp.]|nr:hypothetical protein [Desulfobacula sp.]
MLNISRWMVLIVCTLLISTVINASAVEKKDMGGWGLDDPYNQLYDAGDVDDAKVIVVDIKQVVPLPGMSPATAMVVLDGDDEILVHVCPVWYKRPGNIGVRKGDKIKLRGYFTEINGIDVIMAAKIKNKGKTFKIRLTSDGTPFWTMSPARLQKELSD